MLGKPCINLFSPTRLIKSIKHEHSCKILYILLLTLLGSVFVPCFVMLSCFDIILVGKGEPVLLLCPPNEL